MNLLLFWYICPQTELAYFWKLREASRLSPLVFCSFSLSFSLNACMYAFIYISWVQIHIQLFVGCLSCIIYIYTIPLSSAYSCYPYELHGERPLVVTVVWLSSTTVTWALILEVGCGPSMASAILESYQPIDMRGPSSMTASPNITLPLELTATTDFLHNSTAFPSTFNCKQHSLGPPRKQSGNGHSSLI